MKVLSWLKDSKIIFRIRKSRGYSRIRQYLPQPQPQFYDDSDYVEKQNAKVVTIDWPTKIKKPVIGIVRDYGIYPRWTKYVRFLDNNGFSFGFLDLHTQDWIAQARRFDVILGFPSSHPYHLEETRRKYYLLEKHLGKTCYPSTDHLFLYEDKRQEAYLSEIYQFPFAKTFISTDKDDALRLIESLDYPVISKVDPSSGSMGVELIPSLKSARRLVNETFSGTGRATHVGFFRQKHYIYLQEFIPNHGFDVRVISCGNKVFGYFRNSPNGDFRASGMNLLERKALPHEAVLIGYQLNKMLKHPQIAVDMVYGLDGKYHIVEFSPFFQVETTIQLEVDGEPGAYIMDSDTSFHFEKGRYWIHELALKEYLEKFFLLRVDQEPGWLLNYDYV